MCSASYQCCLHTFSLPFPFNTSEPYHCLPHSSCLLLLGTASFCRWCLTYWPLLPWPKGLLPLTATILFHKALCNRTVGFNSNFNHFFSSSSSTYTMRFTQILPLLWNHYQLLKKMLSVRGLYHALLTFLLLLVPLFNKSTVSLP